MQRGSNSSQGRRRKSRWRHRVHHVHCHARLFVLALFVLAMSAAKKPECARVLSIDALTEEEVGTKVRIAGRLVAISNSSIRKTSSLAHRSHLVSKHRVLAFEAETQYLLLASRTKAVWVNVSIVIDLTSSAIPSFGRESDSVIMVMGNVDLCKVCLPLRSHSPSLSKLPYR